jgi:uncharacterized Fe-S cluster protein YjdI/CDGSH-type Zn-finger protein
MRGPGAEKSLTVDLAVGLMQALMPLAERAARLPAGPSNPHCNAGVSFIALRDPSPLPPGRAARRLFIERFTELREAGAALGAGGDARATQAAERLAALAARAEREFELSAAAAGGAPAGGAAAATASAATAAGTGAGSSSAPAPAPANASAAAAPPPEGIETVRGETLELQFEAQRCIHSRFCVTWAPRVFLANVPGAWIHPDAMPVERVVEVAHACPSGAIRYRRLDGGAEESAPPVNLASVREGGPYAFRAELRIDGAAAGYRATLCRCGASKHKPYCDGSHHTIGFNATGEPLSGPGARQSRDHERHRPRGGARHFDLPVPLRRQRHQAVLRRHPREDRLQLRMSAAVRARQHRALQRGAARRTCSRATARRNSPMSRARLAGAGRP